MHHDAAQDLSGLDRIRLTGVSAHGHHGVFAAERASGQLFVVDVELYADLDAAATTDDLTLTVDYGVLAADIVADIEGEPLDLIESLAWRVSRTCLRRELVRRVEVTVHKPEAPVPVAVADIAVTLTATRPDSPGDAAPQAAPRDKERT